MLLQFSPADEAPSETCPNSICSSQKRYDLEGAVDGVQHCAATQQGSNCFWWLWLQLPWNRALAQLLMFPATLLNALACCNMAVLPTPVAPLAAGSQLGILHAHPLAPAAAVDDIQ